SVNQLIVSITLLFFEAGLRFEDIAFFPDINKIESDYINNGRKHIKLYSGKEYFTFREEFNRAPHQVKRKESQPYKILVTMGGSDPYGIADVVYEGLKLLSVDF